jgi:dolichyl-phosphate-mannose--protein O-mannosyl transferase
VAASAAFCLLGWLINLLPYSFIHRTTFAYHYMPALVYGELIVARSIQVLAGPRYTPMAAKLYLGAVGLVWLHYTPWIYGMGLTNDGHQRRRWIDRWN